jgi:hypothetical protein
MNYAAWSLMKTKYWLPVGVSSHNLRQFSLFALLPNARGHDPFPQCSRTKLLWQRRKDFRKKILVVTGQILGVGSLHD